MPPGPSWAGWERTWSPTIDSRTTSLSTELLAWTTPSTSLALLLLAGHLLGDFAFQTRRMVEGKHRPRVLAGHALVVWAVHLATLLPYLGSAVVGVSFALGASHGVIDSLKSWLTRQRDGASFVPFVADQLAHLGVLAVAYLVLTRLTGPLPARLSDLELQVWTLGAVLAAVFAFNWTGGAVLVSGVLDTLSPSLEEDEDSGVRGSGRLIGILERTIALILIVLGEWGALALLLTAKSIARFEELKDRRFAEYYLVGTLTSLLVAIVTGLALGAALAGGLP